ncbi:hypothetical protein ANO14919_106870 [Xylariales sp. No.14919]|nr:hypothetical protein ANO14919_106870 [Xylariales sp. No.14919]
MGMLLLAYMTNVSSNIVHPRAWISMQYAVVNIASTIFVSSGTTNVIIASAFNIGFAQYTANTIVPVLATSLVLFPWLLYFVFANESLIPISIATHPLSAEERALEPPNPVLDKLSAGIGIILMIATLVVLIVLSVVTLNNNKNIPVFWVTLPAAFLMLVWDIFSSWYWRKEIREIARRNREPAPRLKSEQEAAQMAQRITSLSSDAERDISNECQTRIGTGLQDTKIAGMKPGYRQTCGIRASCSTEDKKSSTLDREKQHTGELDNIEEAVLSHLGSPSIKIPELDHHLTQPEPPKIKGNGESCISTIKRWLPESFLTTMFILARLPYTVVPFAIPMFVLVQALVEKGWVVLLARGWSIWVVKTGTVGAIGGMGFLSVILSNFAGTNIGATVLLCRVLQTWQKMHPSSVSLDQSPDSISDRTWWGAVYALALGVNYGAFSISFGASLAGLSWREDLAKNHLHVRGYEFAKVNLPIIAAAMSVGCAVLVGQVYITR